jgi:hypothetical protein
MKTINNLNRIDEPNGVSVRVKIIIIMSLVLMATVGVTKSERNKVETLKVKEYEDRVCVDHNNDDKYTCYDKVAY